MDEDLMKVWFDKCWEKRDGGVRKQPSILVMDSFEGMTLFVLRRSPIIMNRLFTAHKTESVKARIKEDKGELLILPGGTTSKAQPLDKLVNRAFKKEVRDL